MASSALITFAAFLFVPALTYTSLNGKMLTETPGKLFNNTLIKFDNGTKSEKELCGLIRFANYLELVSALATLLFFVTTKLQLTCKSVSNFQERDKPTGNSF